MLRNLVVMAFIAGFIQAPRHFTSPSSHPDSAYNLYLPLVTNSSAPVDLDQLVDIVNLGVVDWIGYPGYLCLYGYITGITPNPVYSVSLAIEVTVYPYEDPIPYDGTSAVYETHYATPKLYATLPDQKNPFSYCLMYAKSYYGYGDVELASASLNPPDGGIAYPVTITSTTKEGSGAETSVYGTVQNDSGQRLSEVRVVGMAGLCSAKEATLGVTTLEPGEQTNYTFNQFYCPSSIPFSTQEEMVEISAQGVAAP